MQRQQKRRFLLSCILALAGTTMAVAQTPATPGNAAPAVTTRAVSAAGHAAVARMAPTMQMAGQTVQLNGKGIRYRAVVRVYEIGLYTTAKVNSAEQLVAIAGPKRLQLVTLRELTGDMLGVAMVQGMQDNAPAGERVKLITHMERLSRIFGSEPQVSAGSLLNIDYIPGKGTAFYLNGEQKGDFVTDPAYFAAVARIWLGPKPADANLKYALLGIEARRTDSGGG